MQRPQRIVEACGACGRQYDVTHVPRGARVRCLCGASLEVRHAEPHAPRALRCSNCGGELAEGARKCAYCSAEVTLLERRLDAVCPGCFARCASDARFCMECGVRIDPQALFALVEDQACPRCAGTLRQRAVGNLLLVECRSCAGVWLTARQFDFLCRRSEADAVAPGTFASGLERKETYERQKYIPCLACSTLMLRRNYAGSSGIVLDACRQHGVWLDADELERVLAFIRDGGLDRAREKQIRRLREQEIRARAVQNAGTSLPDLRRPVDDPVVELGLGLSLSALLDLLID